MTSGSNSEFSEKSESVQQALAALDTARQAVLHFSEWDQRDQQELAHLKKALEDAVTECDYWKHECGKAQAAARTAESTVSTLQSQIADLHQDLRATDLPTLILKTCLSLTQAEQGLYTGASGEPILADVGLQALQHVPNESFYAFTREAAEKQEPVVRNDGDNLPGGLELVNLAAVPVALRGAPAGVILVANKRSGPFTEDDTHALMAVGRHAGIALENKRLHQALAEAYVSTIAALADAIKAKDPYTRGHCEEVSMLAVRVASRLGITGTELEDVRYAALLHDVGKIGVPDGILLKPGKLSNEERLIVEKHAQIGSDLVSRVAALADIVPHIRHHHERVNGQGYPDGLTGEDISLPSRIIAVVDALDAMTSPRPYRSPIERDEALAELQRCAGEQFDAHIVAVVQELLNDDKNSTTASSL